MKTFSHAVDLAFEVISHDKNGDDITPNMYRAALEERMDELDREGTWSEAIGYPFDTYEMEGES